MKGGLLFFRRVENQGIMARTVLTLMMMVDVFVWNNDECDTSVF